MDGNKLIDNLLSYAVKHLYLNELDLLYKKSVLCTVLNVKENKNIEINENVQLSSVVENLKEFLKENERTDINISSAIDYIFGLIMPLPSSVDKTFKTLREKMGAKKAYSYFYNLSKDGDFSLSLDKEFIESESKKTLKIMLKKCACGSLYEQSDNRLNKCKVTLDFAGNAYILSASRNARYPYQGTLTTTDNKQLNLNENSLEAMLCFVEYSPEFFISSSTFNYSENNAFDKFYVGGDNLSFFRAKPHFVSKNEVYPDVEIAYVDWYISTLRLASYNKNTLINTALEIINAWGRYSDSEGVNFTENDKKYTCVFASMLQDGRYAINIVLLTDKLLSKIDLSGEKFNVFFKKSIANSSILRVFALSKNYEEYKDYILNVLTKKHNQTTNNNEFEVNCLNVVNEFINSMINSYGYFKDTQKAENAVLEELLNICNKSLEDLNLFKVYENNFINVKRFLMSVKIK